LVLVIGFVMKVLIVDDHPIVVSGFKALLEGEGNIEVLEAASARDAEQVLSSNSADIAVVDINLPGTSGFELARRLIARDPTTKILMFSMNDDPVFVAQAMDVGAKGYVSKNDNPIHMLRAIMAVVEGGTAWPPGMAERVAHLNDRKSTGAATSLSPRDLDILRLLTKGKSLSEIADIVGVSYKTIATTCAALRSKLNARTQAELIAIAVERKLV
jgi:two-component system, NarL family, invasion response regulator UvrY